MDSRLFHFQKTIKVATIFLNTADGSIPEAYVSIRNLKTKDLKYVSSMDQNVEPWIYPLFYPHGTQGWHRNIMRLNSNRRVSRCAYIKYRMAIRDNEFNPFILGRRLFQQWVVDSYVKVEKDKIQYCKDHQKEIKADSYEELKSYLDKTADNVNGQVGKIVVLPSTFIGSPRNMLQNFQDAMAIVRKLGCPDLFITMTCNPNWPEITENLLPGQTSSDRPDLISRVFNLKKNYLIDLIRTKQFFGKSAAYVYVIEFQKRGLPHVHLLLTLAAGYKFANPETVDKFISAEIPSPEENLELNNRVLKHMIHGPCGDWCIKNGRCSKHYPMEYLYETSFDESGFPQYRRRNTGATYQRSNNFDVDNRHVVPYNPTLLMIFNCHLNVVVVSSIKAVKYLFKYVYKGHDAAAVQITECTENSIINHDETQHYIETRYVGPSEATWRILSKPLHEKSHNIIRLPVHLPNQQNITYNDSTINSISNAMNKDTMLLDYFALNERDENARQYLYIDIPNHYTFTKITINGVQVKQWQPRQNHFNVIGRMYCVSPSKGELFYLRLLLLHVKGSTSFQNLKIVDGIVHQTFISTCLALNLIEDDEEWKKAMHEACIWMMPQRLRHLFVRILIHCQPLHPEELWTEFKEAMSEDYLRYHSIDVSEKKAYADINNLLLSEGYSLANFPSMDQTIHEVSEDDNEDILIQEYVNKGTLQYQQLNSEQLQIVDSIIINATTESNCNTGSNCYFIDGPGGSGKTFIYTTLYYLLKSKNKKVSNMAFTGIAATLLPSGKTVHKTFGLPVPLDSDSSSNIKFQSKEADYLRQIDVFIWDEAPMAPRYALEIIDKLLQFLMNNNKPFGGKIMVLGGDFRQLLPVKLRGTRSEVVNLCIKYSNVWKKFTYHKLTQNMRVMSDEIDFATFLLQVGDGILNDNNDNIQLPDCCIAPLNTYIAKYTYETIIKEKNYKELSNCAILAAMNIDVNEINSKVVDLLDKDTEKIYTSIDSTENCDDNGEMTELISPEYLNTLSPTCLPPYELRLRKHSIVMLIRNISIKQGLCNGTRLRVLDFSNHLLKCEILTGDKVGKIVFLNRITLYSENDFPFTFKRRQFPVKLAFAMTINKAQGQTFKSISLNLAKEVFSHGQLYVALSRVRSIKGVKVFLAPEKLNTCVKNYVY